MNRIITPEEFVRDVRAAIDKAADEEGLSPEQKRRLTLAVCYSIVGQSMDETNPAPVPTPECPT